MWGIIDRVVDVGRTHRSILAVAAPGIAEALRATGDVAAGDQRAGSVISDQPPSGADEDERLANPIVATDRSRTVPASAGASDLPLGRRHRATIRRGFFAGLAQRF